MNVRRQFVISLALPLAFGLAACGGDDDATTDSAAAPAAESTSTPSTSDSSTSDSSMRIVDHAMGTTEVPAHPERVVVLDSSFLDAAVALGVEPVGATEASAGFGMPEYLADEVEGIDVVGLTDEPNLEAIAALQPDLILGAKVRHEALYDQLSGIAPTVFSESSGTNWKDGLAITAEALGKTAEADEWLASYEERADEIGAEVGADGTHVSMVRFLLPDEIRIYGPETFSGTVLSDVGFDLGDHAWDEYSMAYVSAEQLDQADADVIFSTSYGGTDAPEFETTFGPVRPLWETVPAVADGRQHWVEDDIWMLGIGPVGAGLILDDIETMLAG